jgi:hypothetical protein
MATFSSRYISRVGASYKGLEVVKDYSRSTDLGTISVKLYYIINFAGGAWFCPALSRNLPHTLAATGPTEAFF